MSTFDNKFKDGLILECENYRDDGHSIKEIITALVDVLAYIVEWWFKGGE